MPVKVIIARYGEIHLKGHNRGFFLNALMKNLESNVGNECEIAYENSRYIFSKFESTSEGIIMQKIAKTFGIISVSLCFCVHHEEILKHLETIKIATTFKVVVNRADKSFPHTSMEFAAIAGGIILAQNPDAYVDVNKPATVVNIDIRNMGKAFIYDNVTNGLGGMPVGTAGRGIVLLSGGIDSPCSAYLASKRGLSVDFVHFASPPFTSEYSLDKVKRLGGVLQNYIGHANIFVIPFTEIQEQIRKKCDASYLITIMRQLASHFLRICS